MNLDQNKFNCPECGSKNDKENFRDKLSQEIAYILLYFMKFNVVLVLWIFLDTWVKGSIIFLLRRLRMSELIDINPSI